MKTLLLIIALIIGLGMFTRCSPMKMFNIYSVEAPAPPYGAPDQTVNLASQPAPFAGRTVTYVYYCHEGKYITITYYTIESKSTHLKKYNNYWCKITTTGNCFMK
jgi:hypothetical protein